MLEVFDRYDHVHNSIDVNVNVNIICSFIPISISTSFIQIKDFDPIAEFKNRNKQHIALIPNIIAALHNSPLPSIPDPTPYNDSARIFFSKIGTANPSHLCPNAPEYQPEPIRHTSPILPDAKQQKAAWKRTLSYHAPTL